MSLEDALPVDLSRLDDVTGGDVEFTIELVELFLSDAGATLKLIEAAAGDSQRDVLRREAHKLKGSSGNIGAATLAQRAREIEQGAPEGDLGMLRSQVGDVGAEFQKVSAQLEQYLTTLRSSNA